jgi:hypothetical protein
MATDQTRQEARDDQRTIERLDAADAYIAKNLPGAQPLFKCVECGRRFRTVSAAERAVDEGCPRCGGSDVDLA